MPDDLRSLTARLERFAATAGIDPDELTKALESGGHYAPEELISRTSGYDPDAAYRIRVDLPRARPPAWRRLEIPSTTSLDQVSRILQAAFGWPESAMHEFETVYGRFAAPEHTAELPELDDRAAPYDEASATLAQVIPAKNVRKISYVYTLGAYLRQAITLEEICPAGPGVSYPRCTGGRRASVFADFRRTRTRTPGTDDEPFSADRVTAALARLIM